MLLVWLLFSQQHIVWLVPQERSYSPVLGIFSVTLAAALRGRVCSFKEGSVQHLQDSAST